MSNATIVSWNMQGWGSGRPEENEKMRALCRAIAKQVEQENQSEMIILLQECGNPETSGMNPGTVIQNPYDGQYYVCQMIVSDRTAQALRCSTAILTSYEMEVAETSCLYPYGITRPVVYIIYKNVIIATIHAIADASQSVAQLKAVMQTLDKKKEEENRDAWILMGDFNTDPHAFVPTGEKIFWNVKNYIQYAGTSRNPKYAWLIATRYPTQGGGSPPVRNAYLDYAFMSDNTEYWDVGTAFGPFESGELIGVLKVSDEHYRSLSDHSMVGSCFE